MFISLILVMEIPVKYRKDFSVMKENITRNTEPAEQKTRTKIIVDHTFGEGDFMELFTDYIAGKIQSNSITEQKNTPEMTA